VEAKVFNLTWQRRERVIVAVIDPRLLVYKTNIADGDIMYDDVFDLTNPLVWFVL
jgi:hypothetical protein